MRDLGSFHAVPFVIPHVVLLIRPSPALQRPAYLRGPFSEFFRRDEARKGSGISRAFLHALSQKSLTRLRAWATVLTCVSSAVQDLPG